MVSYYFFSEVLFFILFFIKFLIYLLIILIVPCFSILVNGFVTVIIFGPDLFSGSPFKLSEVLLLCCHHSLSISFLLTQNVISLYCTVSVLVLDQLFLQGTLVPFSRKWFLETKIWILGVLFAVECCYSQDLRVDKAMGRECVWLYMCIHTFACVYLSLYMQRTMYVLVHLYISFYSENNSLFHLSPFPYL